MICNIMDLSNIMDMIYNIMNKISDIMNIISNFLGNCSQMRRTSKKYSAHTKVASVLVWGSCSGFELFTVLIETLLYDISNIRQWHLLTT